MSKLPFLRAALLVFAVWTLAGCGPDAPDANPAAAVPVAASGGATVVRVPGGVFPLGDSFNEGEPHERPTHQATLTDFWMGRTEVSVEEFAAFVQSTGYRTTAEVEGSSFILVEGKLTEQQDVNWRHDPYGQLRGPADLNHPVLHVSWYDAIAYCNWRSLSEQLQPVYSYDTITRKIDQATMDMLREQVRLDDANKEMQSDMMASEVLIIPNWEATGYRLPTETEWEYAARNGGKAWRYAWGEGQPHANIADDSALKAGSSPQSAFPGYSDGFPHTAPVGSFPQGDLGLSDLTGNVWEWCWDLYGPYPTTPTINYRGPEQGSYRILRGGAWRGSAKSLRTSNRNANSADVRGPSLGFRVARSK